MRRVWMGVLIVVLCCPLLYVLGLMAAAQFPALDRMTLQMPSEVRVPVAEIALKWAGYGSASEKALKRVVTLDPNNSDAWGRRCQIIDVTNAAEELSSCQRAVQLNPIPWNYNGLGLAQEKMKDYCDAEDSFTKAIGKQSGQRVFYLRNMGGAALRCGHREAAAAGFEVAEQTDAKSVDDPEDEDSTEDNLKTDREYLVLIYDRMGETEKSAQMCTKVHPQWKGCACELADDGVKCAEHVPAAGK